ncbi:hypothetical protein PV762_18450 [Mitsuaria sp. CC2]|uniref:hypothetical protein n=1 Tax=Mitsuaria sp. CC2 TaxID=3029186 RepID=UPI003B8AE604
MKLHVFVRRSVPMLGLSLVASTATGVVAAPATIDVGMTCTVPDGWWSLDRERPRQPEPVKVLALKSLTTGAPGAWVQPQRGKLTDQQMHLALERLTDCH